MASTSSWIPPPGRHTINIGSSLGRAIKSRKLKGSPAPTTKRSNLPERDFYSFKFNFKASSVDATKPASIEIKKGAENTQIRAEFPSTQAGEVHTFNGTENPARDVDCILIYDEETGQYTLEKLESCIQLKFDRKMASTRPASPTLPAASKGKAKQEDYEMSPVEDDRIAEIDADNDELEKLLNETIAEELEEGEEIELPHKPLSPPKQEPLSHPVPAKPRPSKPLPQRAEKPSTFPPPPVAANPAPAPSPVTRLKPKPALAKAKKPKLDPATLYPDEEIIEIGNLSRQVAPATIPPKPQPPRAPSPRLSFPGGSNITYPLSSIPAASKPTVPLDIPIPQRAMPPSPQAAQPDTDDEEDWEPVTTAIPTNPQADNEYEASLENDIFGDFEDNGDDGGEGGNFLDHIMTESDDEDMEAVSLEPEPDPNRKPMSIKESLGGAVESDDEDFSSSDESDDD